MRVTWSTVEELAADDISDYFQRFDNIIDLDWLEEGATTGMETIKLKFESAAGVSDVMKNQPRLVTRECDGKVIKVKAHVKFSDNMSK